MYIMELEFVIDGVPYLYKAKKEGATFIYEKIYIKSKPGFLLIDRRKRVAKFPHYRGKALRSYQKAFLQTRSTESIVRAAAEAGLYPCLQIQELKDAC